MAINEVTQGKQYQSADEQIAYSITTTPWGTSPSSVTAKAFLLGIGEPDVTSTVFPVNSPSVAGDVITLSLLKSLTKGYIYRVEVKFTSGGNVFECYFFVECDF